MKVPFKRKDNRRALDQLSAYLFFLGFLTSLLTHLFFPKFLTILTLGFNFTAYCSWSAASQSYDKIRHKDARYGFMTYQQQHQIASMSGILAMMLFSLSFIFPGLFLGSSLLFAMSNLIWCVAELHKNNNPDFPKNQQHQHTYLSYAISVTAGSLLSVATIILPVIFPPIKLIIPAFVPTVTLIVLRLTSSQFWLRLQWNNDEQPHEKERFTQEKTALISTRDSLLNPVSKPKTSPSKAELSLGFFKKATNPSDSSRNDIKPDKQMGTAFYELSRSSGH